MESKDFQVLLTAAGYYNDKIDGIWGQKTVDAAKAIVQRHTDELVGYSRWDQKRIVVGAGQLVLKYAGFSPGIIDGLTGHNTSEAFEDWQADKAGSPRIIDRTPVADYKPVSGVFPKQSQCVSFYGKPGLPGTAAEKAMSAKLIYIDFPIAMRLDFDLSQKVTRTRLHQKCAASAQSAYQEAVKHYGASQFCALGLDRFAGAYMPRYMRGSSKTFSMHAYGCAIDTYAAPNGLNVRKPKALFSGADYDAWFNIWEAAEWTSLGRAIDRDYMHVQAASL